MTRTKRTAEEIRRGEAAYPALLETIQTPPAVLHTIGNRNLLQTPCLAIVGSRKCSAYGRWAAYELAKTAAGAGITVVSGMALGVDSAAHRGALDGGGFTIAVLGCGVDVCYPGSNRELYEQIVEKGLLVSEYPNGQSPHPGQFPVRNRIISGLSVGTVVVEATLSSGSLITAGHAAEQGREVLAVPGNLNQVASYGCNKLIRDGAGIVTSFDDVLDLFPPECVRRRQAVQQEADLSREERAVYRLLQAEGELSLNGLALRLTSDPGKIAATVTQMELKGLVITDLGKVFLAKV